MITPVGCVHSMPVWLVHDICWKIGWQDLFVFYHMASSTSLVGTVKTWWQSHEIILLFYNIYCVVTVLHRDLTVIVTRGVGINHYAL